MTDCEALLWSVGGGRAGTAEFQCGAWGLFSCFCSELYSFLVCGSDEVEEPAILKWALKSFEHRPLGLHMWNSNYAAEWASFTNFQGGK